jgi:hypothetical protein
MPVYTVINKTNQEHTEVSLPKIVHDTGSLLARTSDGWKDHLKEIKKGSGRSNTIKT